MNRLFILFGLTYCFQWCQAQTPATERIQSIEKILKQPSPLDGIQFRNIGPTVMSGRVTDLDVNPENPHEFYVAYASGGLWYTNTNGLTLQPVFDQEAALTIGDVAVDWKRGVLWVGTGEVNSSRSSYAGTGVYKSTDQGRTWLHMGLEESHHIGRIVLHPSNPNIAWVAVLGHLYTANPERGLYKTTDGGQHWNQTLFINDTTGCVDLILDPMHPEILYASSWTRTRKAWNFNGCGSGSAIYKSQDGGEHWIQLSGADSGFPQNDGIGRIGLAICQKDPQVLYALLDNNNHRPKEINANKDLDARELKKMSRDEFLKLDEKKLDRFLRQNDYPEKYTASGVKQAVRNNEYTVAAVADWYLSDADASLFDTPVFGAELYRSRDAGKTWMKTHDKPMDGMYFTYGYYFGTVAVSPKNPEEVWIAGYPLAHSTDGGKQFQLMDGDNCHPDYHRIWIHPNDANYLIVGNDGGVNITYDAGKHWYKANNPAVGQFYAIQTDDAKPYNVYGGLQDNGTWTGPSTHEENNGWHQSGAYPYKELGGGDGMQVEVDRRNNNTVYFGYQFGNYFRADKTTGLAEPVKPIHDIGQKAYRFNWQTPIHLSRHQQDIFYLGSNYFHRSLEQGNHPQTQQPELAPTPFKGNVPYGTLTSIAESPKQIGLLYAGSDNGLIHLSKDLGMTWTRISNQLPQGLWVSRLVASQHKISRVYATLNGYRQDDFNPYVFVSDDYGRNWQRITKGLPMEPVNVLREDPANEKILYVGTDNGLYVSFDGGMEFIPWRGSLPRVAIHDLNIQERESEIILGTHGRSLYRCQLEEIRAYPGIRQKDLYLFTMDSIRYNSKWGLQDNALHEMTTDSVLVRYYVKDAGNVNVQLLNAKNVVFRNFNLQARQGFNQYFLHTVWDAPGTTTTAPTNKPLVLQPGRYTLLITTASGTKEKVNLSVYKKD